MISDELIRGDLSTDAADNEQPISFSHVMRVVWRRRTWLGRLTLIATALATVIVFLVPVEFTSEAVILPPQSPRTLASTFLEQLPSLSALGAISGLTGGSGTNIYLYMAILRSRTVADALISRFHLQTIYDEPKMVDARKRLARHTTIATNRDPLIHIRVEDHDPKLAAQLANAYVEELFKQNAALALTEAAQRRLFYEQQLAKEKDALADAEVNLRSAEHETGLVVPAGQAEAIIRGGAQLRAAIAARQAELDSMKTFATAANPAYRRLQEEIVAMQAQLRQIESGTQAGSLNLSTEQLPNAGMKVVRKLRDLKYHETLFEVLAKQYEAARLDEAKSVPVIQIVDRAVIPERKSWPPRLLTVLLTPVLAFAFGSLWLLSRENSSDVGSA